MNAEALFHTIRLKVPSQLELRDTLSAVSAKIMALRPFQAERRRTTDAVAECDHVISFESVVSSAITAPPRRLTWHPLAVLDFALTGAVIMIGGLGTWLLVDMMLGFLTW